MASSLTVLIATAGRSRLLDRTLASLSECQRPDIYRETVVVENGSKGRAEEIVHSYCASLNTRYLHISVANKSVALNEALETIEEGLVFFTDDDIRLHPQILMTYAEVAEGTDEGQFYGGPVDIDYEEEPRTWLKKYLPGSAKGWGLHGSIEAERSRFFLGCNWAVFASDVKTCGGFDIATGPGTKVILGEEGDLQRRLMEGGVRQVFLPRALVWHFVPAERCSPLWILKRSFLVGVERGARSTDRALLTGVRPYMIKACVFHGLRTLKYAVLGDRKNGFDALYNLFKYCGIAYGSMNR